jgi:starch synthase
MSETLRVLHVASEAVPFVKTGGLADVAGALPGALCGRGVDARVAIPGYRRAKHVAAELGLTWLPNAMTIEAGGVEHRIGVGEVKVDGCTFYLLACNELFERDGVYGPAPSSDYEDNARRYSVFCKAALALPGFLKWSPHIVHAHDWQTGLVPALLERGFNRSLPATRSVFTIHNIAYQGRFPSFDIKLTGLDPSLYNPQHCEHFGRLNLLKTGIVFADRVTTVSRRYANEIQGQEFGWTLDAAIRAHGYKLDGITNGIDTDVWNPATDPYLPAHYDADDLSGKAICKAELQKEVGLPVDPHACVVGLVSRLVNQKGIDLVPYVVDPYILAGRMQLVVLGAGQPELESALRHLQGKHPSRVCFWHGYNEGLAHRIEAGSDLFLMPSRFEPCGLNQMYSLRYGTLPLVRYTGGLADTITDVASGHGNGFTFGPMDYGHFSSALDRAIGLYHHFPKEFKAAQVRAMGADNSWDRVAGDYEAYYRKLALA